MAESSTTPADPREIAADTAAVAARAYYRSVPADLWASLGYALGVARQVVDALADAGMLTLPNTEGVDEDVLEVLQYVSRGRRYVDVEPYPDFNARRALGRIGDREVAALRASGTPVETIADALKDMRLNLERNTLEAIYGGQNHLILSGAERHAIALTAVIALGLEET